MPTNPNNTHPSFRQDTPLPRSTQIWNWVAVLIPTFSLVGLYLKDFTSPGTWGMVIFLFFLGSTTLLLITTRFYISDSYTYSAMVTAHSATGKALSHLHEITDLSRNNIVILERLKSEILTMDRKTHAAAKERSNRITKDVLTQLANRLQTACDDLGIPEAAVSFRVGDAHLMNIEAQLNLIATSERFGTARKREILQRVRARPDQLHFNTAFNQIFDDSAAYLSTLRIVCDDLLRKYRNEHDEVKALLVADPQNQAIADLNQKLQGTIDYMQSHDHYRASAIYGIFVYTNTGDPLKYECLGFLCIDNLAGGFENNPIFDTFLKASVDALAPIVENFYQIQTYIEVEKRGNE